MTFARAELLFIIWAVPVFLLLFAYGIRRRNRILARFSSARGLDAIAPESGTRRRWWKAALVLTATLFSAVALAGPRYGYHWREIEQKGIDILIALDCSRSMLADDIKPTRLDRAKREILDLLAMLRGDRAGLVAFSGTAFLQCPLTLDYQTFHIFLDALTPDDMPVGGTDLHGALTTALAGFDPEAYSDKAILLITDGQHTGRGDPMAAVEEARKAGVKLFAVGVGGEQGVPIPDPEGGFQKDRSGQIVLATLDEEALKRMALRTGGAYVRSVAGDMDLEAIYEKEIREKMSAATVRSGRKQVWEDRYQWFLFLAILCLTAELFLPARKRARRVGPLAAALLVVSLPAVADAGPMRQGVEAYEAGNYEAALKSFIDAQLDAPEAPEILYNLGNAYYKLGQYKPAIENYDAALTGARQDLKEKLHYNLGNAKFKEGDLEGAVESYRAALELNPDDAQARRNLRFVEKVMEEKKKQPPPQGKGEKGEEDGSESEENQEQEGDGEGSDRESDPPRQSPDDRGTGPRDRENPEEKTPEDAGGTGGAGDQEDREPRGDSPTFGDEMDPEQAAKAPQPDAEPEEPQGEAGRAARAGSPGEGEDADADQQARRILNRLEDKPMIPFSHKGAAGRNQAVEKDW